MSFSVSHRLFICALGLIYSLLIAVSASFAQIADTTVYTIIDQEPEFPGGFEAMRTYLLANVNYPSEAKKAGVKGRVFVSFIVETDGRVTDVTIMKGLGFGCDEEALRVISAMPSWTSGSQSGKPLRVGYHLPVLFGMDYPKVRVR